jgi:sialate O-acetylesterase
LWRRDWNRGDLPFFVVQLAPFMAIKPEPSESSWAGLREAQSYTAQTVPNTGVAVITDVGDVQDIHPRRKAPVGERLALLAREIAYKEKITGRSPQFANVKLDGNKARVYFHHVGDGLTAQGMDSNGKPVAAGKVVGFAVAGSDGKFVWADVAVTGKNEVTLTAPSGVTIQQVRFGWADFPVVNLTSKAGLPVDPFRTDAPAPALK